MLSYDRKPDTAILDHNSKMKSWYWVTSQENLYLLQVHMWLVPVVLPSKMADILELALLRSGRKLANQAS